jgi:zinc protease
MRCMILAVLLLCVVWPGQTRADLPAAREFTLRNGLRVILAPDSQATAVDVAVWYAAGTRYERDGASGITHLLERLMFQGSARVGPGEHARRIQAEGGSVNTLTTADLSCFFETVPREALPLALELEAERMGSLLLSREKLEAERAALHEERRTSPDRRGPGLALQQLYATAFAGHPYRWPLSGAEADLDRIGLKDCQDYYRVRYGPDRALLTVVGSFDPDEALRAVRADFERLPRRGGAAPRATAVPSQTAERRAGGTTDLPMPLLLVGWRTPPGADRDTPALVLLSRVLTGGPSARLPRALVSERPGCRFVQGGFDSRQDGGLLYVMAVLAPEADSAQVERDLLAEVERLAREPMSGQELDRVRNPVETGAWFGRQTARGRAQALGLARLVDGEPDEAARLARLHALTPADLAQAAQRTFTTANRSVVWMTPARPPGPAAPAKEDRP